MMRNIIAAVIISTFTFTASATSLSANEMDNVEAFFSQQNSSRNHMFDGVSLTEQQRQQMRDLMRQARRDSPPLNVNVNEMEMMYHLVTANHFDESAVRNLTEKMLQEHVARQVEIAKVRHQMYLLLTPAQRTILDAKHQQRMNMYRELSEQQGMPIQITSSHHTQ